MHASGPALHAAPQLLADADAALYKAKAAGRGRYAVFDADEQQSALERLRMAGELRRALEHEQFVLHYQPIVSLSIASGGVRGAADGSTPSEGCWRQNSSSTWLRRAG